MLTSHRTAELWGAKLKPGRRPKYVICQWASRVGIRFLSKFLDKKVKLGGVWTQIWYSETAEATAQTRRCVNLNVVLARA